MRVKLKVLNGKSAGREVKVPDTGFLIGRSQECHLRPKSDAISRQHCEIVIEGEELLIRDMGSKNGTYVNGKRIDGQMQLSQGDQLLVGKLELEVIINIPTPAPVAPPATDSGGDAPDTSKDSGSGTDSSAQSKEDTQSKEDSWAVDDDISTWLEDGDTAGRPSGDPDTRQFKLDELHQTVTDESTLNAMKDASMEDTTASSEDTKKKEPGKLPSRQGDSEDSKAAADDILKRFFNRP